MDWFIEMAAKGNKDDIRVIPTIAIKTYFS